MAVLLGDSDVVVGDHGSLGAYTSLINTTVAASGMSRRELVGMARADRAVHETMPDSGIDADVDVERWDRLARELRRSDPGRQRTEWLGIEAFAPAHASRMRRFVAEQCGLFRFFVSKSQEFLGTSAATYFLATGSGKTITMLWSAMQTRLERAIDSLFVSWVLLLNLRGDGKLYSILQRVRLASQVAAAFPDQPPGEVVVASGRMPRGPDVPREVPVLAPRGMRFVLA
ncbi:hypothetical protein F4560_000938 [Saccharothrix ecbatanensis]|uniref:Uncharacterized protein n=1 Tax=Saccharothrix ecbatanensis TaxID=1105145 RepID=A0A7W9HFA8_9PSEU|nr:hypothetical protein [Saccharothrix ecbatanensis]MBB5801170.1 hypothetical protein [Saccharothrix ecbatanensis]